MAAGVLMPKAGISVESCIIGTWHKQPGDRINIGDVLFDYETDKAAFECESTAEGTLIEVFFNEGDEVPCLTIVCAIGQMGEDVSALRPSVSPQSGVEERNAVLPSAAPAMSATVLPESAKAKGAVSPRAKRLAERLKVDMRYVMPTGPRGRAIERDVYAAASSAKTGEGIGGRRQDGFIGGTGGVNEDTAAAPVAKTEYTDERMSLIRKAIAGSMSKSLLEIPQLTHHHSCDVTVIMNLRKKFKNSSVGFKGISLGDMVMFAATKTLRDHPGLNAHLISGDILRRFNGIHLGMAVDTPRGLLVPTIFDADKMSLLQLSNAAKEVASLAKSGRISPDLLQGASFTISNLGVLGVEIFTPVINPPQVAILGVCGITQKVREANGNIEFYQSMGLSLTYDHRAVDGAPASRFASELVKNIENFDLLLALQGG